MSCGSSTPSAPPDTQASCSTVSERPNAEARDSSGRSRWTTASRPTLASALQVAADSADDGGRADAGQDAAAAAAAAAATPTADSTSASEWPNRCREPIALPTNDPDPRGGADHADEHELPGGLGSVCA